MRHRLSRLPRGAELTRIEQAFGVELPLGIQKLVDILHPASLLENITMRIGDADAEVLQKLNHIVKGLAPLIANDRQRRGERLAASPKILTMNGERIAEALPN